MSFFDLHWMQPLLYFLKEPQLLQTVLNTKLVNSFLHTFQLWLTLWHWLCNGSRNFKSHVRPVFQTKTRAGWGTVNDGHWNWHRHFLKRFPRGTWVSELAIAFLSFFSTAAPSLLSVCELSVLCTCSNWARRQLSHNHFPHFAGVTPYMDMGFIKCKRLQRTRFAVACLSIALTFEFVKIQPACFLDFGQNYYTF